MEKRPFVKDIEAFVNEFVCANEGKLVQDIVGKNPGFSNADYFFPKENVLIELKCFEKDPFSKDDEEGNVKLVEKWLSAGHLKLEDLPKLISGELPFPSQCKADIIAIARKLYEAQIRKANRQLRATKEKIGDKNTRTVLMLCNDGNYLLSDYHALHQIADIFVKRKDLGIDCFIFFTVNQVSRVPNDDTDWAFWVPGYKEAGPNPLCEFVDDLGRKFDEFYVKHFNLSEWVHNEFPDWESGQKAIKAQRHIPKDIIYPNKK